MRQALVVIESMEAGNIHRSIYNALVELGLPCYPLDLPRDSSATDQENARLVAELSQRDDVGMVLLVGPNDHLAEFALDPAKRSGKRVVSVQIDDPWAIRLSQVRLTGLYDEVLTNDLHSVSRYLALGVSRCDAMPFGIDPLIFHSSPGLQHIVYQILFLGSAFPRRCGQLQGLKAADVPVACLGPGPLPLWIQNRRVPGWMLPSLFQSARVCLNLADQPDRVLGMKIRPFEIAASRGGCLLSEWWSGCEEFLSDGEDAVFFRTTEELISKARWLLAHSDECTRMAHAAHKRVHGQHTWRHRLEPHVARWKEELK